MQANIQGQRISGCLQWDIGHKEGQEGRNAQGHRKLWG